MVIKTFVEQMKDKLIELGKTTDELINLSCIKEFRNDPHSGLIFVRPPYYWGELSPDGETIQTKAIVMLEELVIQLDLVFDGKPYNVAKKYKETKNYLNRLIRRDKGGDWSVPQSINIASTKLQENIEEIQSLLDWLTSLNERETIVVPDTNALIINNRLESYGQLLGNVDKWTVVVTSTVLRELDELKIKNTGSDFKDKVKKTISYIKGLRNQGDAISGIKIFNDKVTFKLCAIEPDMSKTLPWLAADNNDDRIIASCFDIQIKNPASSVILMTADINLQTKAHMSRLPFVDPDVT